MKLPSGRTLDANRGLISINDDLEIAGGYDDNLPWINQPEWMDDDEWASTTDRLSPAEQVELADAMIVRWQRFRDKAANKA